jgi:D-aminopeptidase
MRARDIGIAVGPMAPGRYNAITDVPGCLVGHTTLIEGDGPLTVAARCAAATP